MSDLCIYELEDIAWEDFDDNHDHIVPHIGGKKSGYAVESDSSKRPRYELGCAGSTVDSMGASDHVFQREEETSFTTVKEEKETILEKGSRSHSTSGAFSASLDGDSNSKTSCSTSFEDTTFKQCVRSSNMDSIGSDLCADDPILDDRATAVDNNLFRYRLNNESHTENDLGFLGNNLQDKQSNDILYYGWPEIENFEDVDRMFRSCDSTFGLEIDDDDELAWFSSSHEIEGSHDALKSSFNFSGCFPNAINSVSHNQEVYQMDNTSMLNNGTDENLTPGSLKRGSQKFTPNGHPTVMNGSGAGAHTDNESQIDSPVSQSVQEKSLEGKNKERSLENGDPFIHLDNLKQAGESNHSLNFQHSFSIEPHQQRTTHETCLQTPIPLINSENSDPSNQVLASPMPTIFKTEDSGLPSVSLMDPSSRSNQMPSLERSHDICFQNPAVPGKKKRERSHQHRLSGHLEKNKLMVKRTDSDPGFPNFGSEVEGQSEVNGGDLGTLGEMDSSNIQESSCMSSVQDEVSIEASSFRQLQNVMEQLDIRTKLCIRDSLYRLARSAEQRHKCVGQTSGGRGDKDTSGALVSYETNKCTGFMDMETDTNPIDRSIAHLLFHRPSDRPANATSDVVHTKSYSMGGGFVLMHMLFIGICWPALPSFGRKRTKDEFEMICLREDAIQKLLRPMGMKIIPLGVLCIFT